MSEDGKFWSVFLVVIASIVISLMFFIESYWTDHNAKIVELIENGVDPVAAMCAMQDDFGTHPVCIVLAVKQ